MASFDAIADLPLEIEACEFEGLEITLGEFERLTTVSSCAAAARRGSARTSSTTPSTTSPSRTPAPPAGLAGYAHLRRVLASISTAIDTLPGRAAAARRLAPTTAAGPSSRRRSTWRCARRGPTSPRRSAASRGRSTSSARCGSPARRATSPPRSSRCAHASTVYPTLRFKLDPTNDWDDELIAALVETGAVDSLDLKGFYKGTAGRRRDRPRALREADRGLPRRLARGPRRHRRDPAAARPGLASGSPGTRRSTRSPTSRRCPGRRRRRSTSSPRGSARSAQPLRRLRLLRGARDRRLRRRPERARPRPRPDPVPRLDLPSRHPQRHRARAATTTPSRRPSPACRPARCEPAIEPTGFRWAALSALRHAASPASADRIRRFGYVGAPPRPPSKEPEMARQVFRRRPQRADRQRVRRLAAVRRRRRLLRRRDPAPPRRLLLPPGAGGARARDDDDPVPARRRRGGPHPRHQVAARPPTPTAARR